MQDEFATMALSSLRVEPAGDWSLHWRDPAGVQNKVFLPILALLDITSI